MKMNIIKSLVVLGLVASTQSVGAYTNKTHLTYRNQALVNLPLEQTGLKERTGDFLRDRYGATLVVTGFYGQNANKGSTGKYFGVNELAKFAINNAAITASSGATTTSTTVDAGYLVHKGAVLAADAFAGTLKLDPKLTHYGVDLVYYQDLAKILNGLYLKINLPVNHVQTDPNLSISATVDADDTINKEDLISFFSGTYVYAPNQIYSQKGLEKAKINGTQSATGVADIDVLLGYTFLRKENYNVSVNLGLSVPSGKTPTGEYMFEPLYGSNHFGFGGGLDAQARVWGDVDHNVKLNATANYRYMFQATEKRTLGLKDRKWGQYYGLLDATIYRTGGGADVAARQLVPAANVLTQNLDVTPGSQLDAIVDLNYNKGGFNFGFGYNVFFKEAESVSRKDSWTDAQYGVYARGEAVNGADVLGNTDATYFDGQTATQASVTLLAAHGVLIDSSKLDLSAAETPTQVTHGLFGGMNYAFKDCSYPLLLGLGGKYEFASKNSSIEVWQVWGKAGLSF